MTGILLDVDRLPSEQQYVCKDGTVIDMPTFLDSYRLVVQALAAANRIARKDSFGFAMAAPLLTDEALYELYRLWNRPEEFVWFVGGWGPDCKRYIANAVRKMRYMLRLGARSTISLRFQGSPDVLNPVDSVDADGNFPLGDFPWGGGVLVQMGELRVPCAISCLNEMDDDSVGRLIGGGLAKDIVIGDGLLSD